MILHKINFSTLVIKVKAGYKDKVINCLRESYEKKNPGIPLKYDDMYQKFMSYNQDITHFSHILFMYACVSIFLTLFGLFGITHYAVSQRKREISIRKIHGASARQILWLINYPFLSYVASHSSSRPCHLSLYDILATAICIPCHSKRLSLSATLAFYYRHHLLYDMPEWISGSCHLISSAPQ